MSCKRTVFVLVLVICGYAEVTAQTIKIMSFPIKGDPISLFVDSRSYEYESLDSSHVRLIYNVDICLDSLDNDRYEQDYVKLVGSDYTKFQPLSKLRYDIINAKGQSGARYIVGGRYIDTAEIRQHYLFFYDAVLENLNDRTITVTSRVCQDDFIFEEPSPKVEWILTDEAKQIDGYECCLAECDFRGRHYYAWYTQDIPLPYGPWLFNGLPGLIVSVYDKSRQYVFTFKSYDGEKDPIFMWKYNYLKTSRKELNKARSEILRKPTVYMFHHMSEEKGWYISTQTYTKYKDIEYRYDTIELE